MLISKFTWFMDTGMMKNKHKYLLIQDRHANYLSQHDRSKPMSEDVTSACRKMTDHGMPWNQSQLFLQWGCQLVN